MAYILGTLVRLTGTFEEAGTPIDPGGVVVKTRDPSGSEMSYTSSSQPPVTRESAGVYFLDITPTTRGEWTYRVEGTTPAVVAAEGTFSIESIF